MKLSTGINSHSRVMLLCIKQKTNGKITSRDTEQQGVINSLMFMATKPITMMMS